MDKKEYYKRIERINNRFKTDRVSADEEYQLVCQRNYLSTKYIEHLEHQCKKQKEVIFKIKMIISARIKEYQKKIDNEIDMGSQGDHFKICRYEENIKFLKDILKEVE